MGEGGINVVTFTGYIVELEATRIRVAPNLEAEPFDGIVFHLDEQIGDISTLTVGQFVRVEHSEMMTKSLPPQAAAHRIDVL
nr:DUF3221 domain-containing protein [Exiguobacterium sp. s142]